MPDGYTFVPFEELTEEMVLDWIKAVVVGGYEEHVNAQIQKQIDEKHNPVVEAALPWAPQSTTASDTIA
jgi:endonuclease I